jgi:streptomycin 6-kinase
MDPKGVVGEPAYDIGVMLRHPLPQLIDPANPERVIARRADQLTEMFELDRRRVLRWGLAHSVLSAWWSIESHGTGWERAISGASMLAELLGHGAT